MKKLLIIFCILLTGCSKINMRDYLYPISIGVDYKDEEFTIYMQLVSYSKISKKENESNYDENMLVSGKYPYLLKQRIAGNKGHLSNAQSLDLARFLYDNGTKCFVLSHISENNNTYELAFSNYVDYFEQNNIQLNKDVYVRVSFQEKRGNNFKLEEDYNGI